MTPAAFSINHLRNNCCVVCSTYFMSQGEPIGPPGVMSAVDGTLRAFLKVNLLVTSQGGVRPDL